MILLEIFLVDLAGFGLVEIIGFVVTAVAGYFFGKGKFGTTNEDNSPNLCGVYNDSVQTMEEVDVQKMIENYRDSANNCDTEWVQFDLEELKRFIYHSEKNAINRGVDVDQNPLGIRVYYSAYSTSQGPGYPSFIHDSNPAYNADCGGRHTLVMIPTFENNNGKHVDFDASKSTTIDLNQSFIDILDAGSTPYSALNHGSLYPPLY